MTTPLAIVLTLLFSVIASTSNGQRVYRFDAAKHFKEVDSIVLFTGEKRHVLIKDGNGVYTTIISSGVCNQGLLILHSKDYEYHFSDDLSYSDIGLVEETLTVLESFRKSVNDGHYGVMYYGLKCGSRYLSSAGLYAIMKKGRKSDH